MGGPVSFMLPVCIHIHLTQPSDIGAAWSSEVHVVQTAGRVDHITGR